MLRDRLAPATVACLITAASCLAPPCRAAEAAQASAPRIEPLTRGRGAVILANTAAIADGVDQQIRNPGSPREAAIIDDVRDVMAHSSEWRWYSRDHGILLAVPVTERLGIMAADNAEMVLADVVRRLINQRGWGNPPVRVVFIEPQLPYHVPTPCVAVPCVATIQATPASICGCQ